MRASSLRWIEGEESRATYAAPIRVRPPAYRHAFCRNCGSALPIVDHELDYAEIPAGTMDDDPGVRPVRHVFTGRRAPWYELTDDLPRHAEHVPRSEHMIARLPRPGSRSTS